MTGPDAGPDAGPEAGRSVLVTGGSRGIGRAVAEAFVAAGAMVGHGGVVVFDDTVDMAAQARFAMEFCAAESCGKCTPCRVGSVRGVEVIDRITAGEHADENLALLEDLCDVMTEGSLCAMGGLTPMPVRSAITSGRLRTPLRLSSTRSGSASSTCTHTPRSAASRTITHCGAEPCMPPPHPPYDRKGTKSAKLTAHGRKDRGVVLTRVL